MREIKFRGLNYSGEWRYGYCGFLEIDGEIEGYILEQSPNKYRTGFMGEGVDASTIGQYTGLKDINGTEIYEGDILGIDGEVIGIVKWDSFTCGFFVDGNCNGEGVVSLREDFIQDYKWVVVGNIYDNPDLYMNI